MTMTSKYAALAETVTSAAGALDASVEAKVGFDRIPAREGVALFRFKSYIEVGKHTVKNGKGKGKQQNWADFEFELVHPDHMIGPDDNRFPDTISLRNINISMNPKAKYFKLFKKMNHSQQYTSFTQMLGQGFLGRLVHNVSNGTTYVNMEEDGQYLIGAPRYNSEPDPLKAVNMVDVDVPELFGEELCFLFDAPGVDATVVKKLWDDIEISGLKKDGTPRKNWIQDKIREANNFDGSFVHQVVGGSAIVVEDVAASVNDAIEAATDVTVADVSETAPVTDPLANIPGM